MKTPVRIYRTADGRLVKYGDPEAAFLAYPAGRDIPDNVASELGLKQGDKPEDKQVDQPEDKASSGVQQKSGGRPRKSRDSGGNIIRDEE